MAKYESRATRLSKAIDLTANIDDVTSIKDELEEWLGNMPENLQASAKAEQLEEAIQNLEEIVDELEEIQEMQHNVEFPGMF
jgi:predicted RNase H-like HicB family nuclease|tara:strand:- start:8057 stop:8302 length:246 start_codon:yes stop_codon:yes gene_type:complete